LDGLFVAGEDSSGVHGANRLGGNGVAESTVFGTIAGDAMAGFVTDRSQPVMDEYQVEEAIARATQPLGGTVGENIHDIRKEIEALMWDKGGIVRSGPQLEEALASLEDLARRAGEATVPAVTIYNMAWQEWLDVQSILTVAQLTCRSALARRESRGSHYRSDYPESDDSNWLCNVMVQQDSGPVPRVWQEDVDFTRLRP
jgi:succinate dehydrogenase / fumarate reductase flavoprotein subunit/fumarate reductase flavoprotein subunit